MLNIIIFLLCLIIILLSVALIVLQKHYDGWVVVTKRDDRTLYSLELDKEPEVLEKMNYIRFRVVKSKSQDKHPL